MLTVGVDLAAEAARTAVAWIDWDETTAVVRALLVGAADADILAAIMEADKAGVYRGAAAALAGRSSVTRGRGVNGYQPATTATSIPGPVLG